MDFVSLQHHNVRGIIQLKPHSRVSLAVKLTASLADPHDNFYNVGGAPRGGLAATPAGDAYGINPDYNSYVGAEVDLIAGWAVTRYAQLEAGYGHFFVGDYVESSLSAATHGSRDADYFYVQLNWYYVRPDSTLP
jgi:hypothetical protein